jgi:hypothetical protein
VTEPPEVAIIVGAFRPREYVALAVQSALAQTVARDRFEIRVTCGFQDPVLLDWLANAQVPASYDPETRIGPWLLRAVRATRAPLIAFLDDDDAYEPDRIERVLQVFHDHPEVGFYRNRVSVIDHAGLPVPPDRWRRLERDPAFDTSGPILVPPGPKPGLAEFASVKTRVTFNTSTMVVRRELLEDGWGDAFARTQLPDLQLFLAGALGPYGLFLDDRRLTRYRFYDANVTHEIGWLAEAARCHRDGAELARAHDRADFAAWLERTAVHFERLFRGGSIVQQVGAGAPRAEVARLTEEYLRFLGQFPAERRMKLDVWAPQLYGFTYCLVPPIARQVCSARAARVPGR